MGDAGFLTGPEGKHTIRPVSDQTTGQDDKEKRVRWRMTILMVGALAVLAGAWLLIVRLERERPVLSFAKEPKFIGADATLEFTVGDRKTGLRNVKAWLRQGQEVHELLSQDIPGGGLWGGGEHSREFRLKLDPKALKLEQGPASLAVTAADHAWWGFGKGNITAREFPVTVDTLPPRVDILSTAHNVKPGGTGLVTYRLSEEAGTTGVEVGDLFFPGYLEAGGGPRSYVAYFALPYDAPPGVRITLMAADQAGNTMRRAFPVHILAVKFPRDTIELTDAFLGAKMPEFTAADPKLGSDPLQVFLKVNSEWRKRDHQKLRELCSAGNLVRLWDGAFLQMKNTQSKAHYAEYRTYKYQGKIVDQQVHLGLDLASTAGAPVPAANTGQVAFAGDLGIYGQVVLLDHGQGLFSLYGHLSGISVSAGQKVAKGQQIGNSGQTGMAGGDHLHFSVLVDGIFVSPLEWLDQHWIDDNVANKLTLFGATPAL